MMASRRYLGDLLKEVQEPFVLQNYINDKHTQLKQQQQRRRRREPVLNTHHHHLQIKKRKPISENSSFRRNLCKNACFFSSSSSSPVFTKSPVFHFYRSSPVKASPCRNSPSNNAFFVFHVPAKTAALLLEAALRIQKPQATHKPKTPKNLISGFLGSIMKKISHGKRHQKNKEIKGHLSSSVTDITTSSSSSRISVKDVMSCDSCNRDNLEERCGFANGFSCSCDSRISSIWSESNDFETSSSGSGASSEMEVVGNQREEEEEEEDGGFCCDEDGGFCSSPFRFVLESSWSPGRGTRELRSPPAPSPGRLRRQALEKDEGNSDCEFEEEEEKDQNSPVSVLDPPFEDEYNEGQDQDFGKEDKQGEFELEHSFAIVQRARQRLLHKLCRLEGLAELDPIELEKKMAEGIEDDDTSEEDEAFIREVLRQSNLYSSGRIPQDMKRLVLDLMAEEEEDGGAEIDPISINLVKKVCKRLESWKEVDMNTIDMMVELDFRSQADEWKKNAEQVQEIAIDIELAIVGFLLEELSCELIHSS